MYPVDLHMHTVASTHAYSTLSDYIAQAKQKGIKLFAITDHGPDMEDAPHHSGREWLMGLGSCAASKLTLKMLMVKLTAAVKCLTRWI